jgi:Uma2 family endonuclease
MTSPTTVRLLTAEEFFDWVHLPENRGKHFELERGKVVEMPPPGERHGATCFNVARLIGNYAFERRRGYVCSNDTGVIWENDPDTVRGPDVMYYDAVRRFAELNPKYSEEPPALAVEVLSPTDRPAKAIQRAKHFLHGGVKVVWILDPEDRTATVYLPERAPEVLESSHELTGGDVLPGFRCRVADLFYLPGEEQAAPAPIAPPA